MIYCRIILEHTSEVQWPECDSEQADQHRGRKKNAKWLLVQIGQTETITPHSMCIVAQQRECCENGLG
jgi:hypothetical protein